MADINVGDTVIANYNSGTYIGVMEEDRGNFLLVQVLAVKTHPKQGDLHNLGQVEGVAFHERKALAYRERMNVQKRKVKRYHEEVPNYIESLKQAVHDYKTILASEDSAYNKLSLKKLEGLEEHFYNKLEGY